MPQQFEEKYAKDETWPRHKHHNMWKYYAAFNVDARGSVCIARACFSMTCVIDERASVLSAEACLG